MKEKKKITVSFYDGGKLIYKFSYHGNREQFTKELTSGKYSGKCICFGSEKETLTVPTDFFGKYLIRFTEQ